MAFKNDNRNDQVPYKRECEAGSQVAGDSSADCSSKVCSNGPYYSSTVVLLEAFTVVGSNA